MHLPMQRGQSRGSAWTRWVLCALLAWPALHAYATSSETFEISGLSLAVGYGQNCAIDTAGQLKCWGNTSYDLDRPPAGRYVSVASGGDVNCALRSDGEAVCWGNSAGGATTPPPGPWRSLAPGSEEGCGLRPDGALQCWGRGRNGVGATAPTGGRFIAVSMSSMGACVIRTDGTLQCWGHPGPGGTDWSTVPPGHFTSVSVKNEHACALRSDGRVLCWGNNYYGQNDAPTDAGFIAVSAGSVLKRDATPPRIVVELRPEAPNAEGWYRTRVDADYRCSDATSGLVGRCRNPPICRGDGVRPFPSQTIRDRAGNIATTPTTPIRIDMTRPELTATMPPAQLLVGATHDFQLSASDALSGIASQSCTPIDTATAGVRQAVCQASDRAGNETVLSAQYEVVVAKHRRRRLPASLSQRRDGVPAKAKTVLVR